MTKPPLSSFIGTQGTSSTKPALSSFGGTPSASSITQNAWASVATPKAPNIGDLTGQQYLGAGQKIFDSVTQGADKLQKATNAPTALGRIGGSLGALGEIGLGTAAGAAQGIFAPITAVAQKAIQLDPWKRTADSPAPIAGATVDLNAKSPVGDSIKSWVAQHPEAARNLMDALTIGGAALGGNAGILGKTASEMTVGEGANILKTAGEDVIKSPITATKAALTPTQDALDKSIVENFTKAIKPTIAGKNTLAQTEKYNNNVLQSMKKIADNKANLSFETEDGTITNRTPRTRMELAQGADQTKKGIYAQYDSLAQQAGKAGITVNAPELTSSLNDIVDNKALQLSHPDAVSYAKSIIDRYGKAGALDAKTTQSLIENYNAELQAFYRNPSYNQASRVAIDAAVVKNAREALDKAITGATGTEYQQLRNQYASLKAVENDINKAANREARLNNKGLVDYTDIFSGGDIVAGIMTLNPALFAKGIAQKGIKDYFKFLNSPDRAITNMFKAAEGKSVGKSVADSIGEPSLGLSTQDVTKNIPAEDLAEMKDFTDYTAGDYKPSPKVTNELKLSAQRIADKYGFTGTASDKSLANQFGRILEKQQGTLDKWRKTTEAQKRDAKTQKYLPK